MAASCLFTWRGGGVVSGCTLQHSQRGLDSTVHKVLNVKHEGLSEQCQMFSKYNSWHNRWLPPKKTGHITKIQKWQELDLAHDFHASVPTTQRHPVASSLFTLKSLHSSDWNVEIKTLTQTTAIWSHKDCKAWTMRWCVSEFDIYPYFEQMQSPDWQAGSGALLSSELGHTVEQRQTMVKQMAWEKNRFISTGNNTMC